MSWWGQLSVKVTMLRLQGGQCWLVFQKYLTQWIYVLKYEHCTLYRLQKLQLLKMADRHRHIHRPKTIRPWSFHPWAKSCHFSTQPVFNNVHVKSLNYISFIIIEIQVTTMWWSQSTWLKTHPTKLQCPVRLAYLRKGDSCCLTLIHGTGASWYFIHCKKWVGVK